MTRSAFIAIIGKPNVGKSSILNRLTGSKIAIVSSKPQTTRTKIMGVLTRDEVQLGFTDTPGFHHAHNKLGEHMNQAVGDTLGGVDACRCVVEPKGERNDKEQELLADLTDGMTFPEWIAAFCRRENIRTHNELKGSVVERNFSNFVEWLTDSGLVTGQREFCA